MFSSSGGLGDRERLRDAVAATAEFERVKLWLLGLNLPDYIDTFERHGLTNLASIELIGPADLARLQVCTAVLAVGGAHLLAGAH